jgi:enoyl-CoA hydratase/carnithine racemase
VEKSEDILVQRDGEVAVVSLNRPEKMNAVGGTMIDDLARIAVELREDGEVRAVVLTGEGRAFCAGADLSPEAQARVQANRTTSLRERLPISGTTQWPVGWFGVNIPKPVVCAINGPAVGWGAEITATCDMRVAGESARIGWVFARRGLVTDLAVGPLLLPRIVGLPQAARLLYSGEIVNAREALRIGLVDEVVPDEELRSRAVALARHLASGSPIAIAVHKRQLYETMRRHPHDIYFENLDEFERTMASEDFKEGVKSFMEKRPPQWTGR